MTRTPSAQQRRWSSDMWRQKHAAYLATRALINTASSGSGGSRSSAPTGTRSTSNHNGSEGPSSGESRSNTTGSRSTNTNDGNGSRGLHSDEGFSSPTGPRTSDLEGAPFHSGRSAPVKNFTSDQLRFVIELVVAEIQRTSVPIQCTCICPRRAEPPPRPVSARTVPSRSAPRGKPPGTMRL